MAMLRSRTPGAPRSMRAIAFSSMPFRCVGGRHPEPVAEIDCAVVDIAQRHLAQEQGQDEAEQGDRRRAQEYLGEGIGVGRHDGRRHAVRLPVQGLGRS